MVVRKSKEEAEHVKGQLLGALDNVKRALQSQMEQIQKRMMKVVVPKSEFDSSINQLSKRFADVEWNILRPNPEVLDSGYRKKFHLAQFMDPTGPFLNETRHPAYSQRDESLKPKQGLEGAVFASERPRGFARTVGEAIPQSVFETKEMRASYTQGRDLHTRGSFAAMRIYGKKDEKYSSLMSPSMERLMAEVSQENSFSSEKEGDRQLLKRVETPPNRVTMLPKLDFINPSDSSHPWQIPPSHKI